MSALSKLCIYWITIILNILSVLINLRTLLCLFIRKRSHYKQYGMVLVTVLVHLLYNISSTVYSVYMVIITNEPSWSSGFVYWSGSLMFCASLSLVCLNICVVIDRLIAIMKPIAYSHKYKTIWLWVTIFILITVFVGNFIGYDIGRIAPNETQHFSGVVDYDMINVFYNVKSAICALNVLLTIFFLWKLRQFVKTASVFHASVSLRIANQIVVYQTVADVIVIVVPTFVTTLINELFDIVITTIVGSYPNALYVAYTTFCACLLVVKLKGAKTQARVNSVR